MKNDVPISILLTTADGHAIHGRVQGSGPAIIIVHPGLDDGTTWGAVAQLLAQDHTVIRPVRRQYDPDRSQPCTISDEADDIIALAEQQAAPVILVGHSSGGIVALDALTRRPELFQRAVLYEPPISVDQPLGGEVTARAQQALAANHPGRAIRIFLRDIVKVPPFAAWAAQAVVFIPRYKVLIPRQIDDQVAIDAVGDARAKYAKITVPVVLIGGDKSPQHLAERLQALKDVLPKAELKRFPNIGHDGQRTQPALIAGAIR